MKTWNNPSRGSPSHIRRRILKRDSHTCQKCGDTAIEVDAIRPEAEGGSHTDPNNLWSLCGSCHDRKTRPEIRRGHQRRQAAGKLPAEKHPGLL